MHGAAVSLETLAGTLGELAAHGHCHGVRVNGDLGRRQKSASDVVGAELAIVKIEDEVTDARILQAPGDHVERRALLGDEHDLLALSNRANDEVRDRLRLTCTWRSFDDDGSAGDGMGDDIGLRRVGWNRKGEEDFFQIGNLDVIGGVCEDLAGGLDEVLDEGIPCEELVESRIVV